MHTTFNNDDTGICDRPRENRPSSHLVMIVEIPVLKILIAFAHVRPTIFVELIGFIIV